MRALITRPEQDAEPLAASLAARGIDAVIQPVLDIVTLPHAPLPFDGVQAILVTSRNGVRALAAATARRDLPVYAVGDATAAAARDLGFAPVISAAGDGGALEALVAAGLDPGAGALLHASGAQVAGDLAGGLERAGFEVRRAVLYEARPVAAFDPAVRDMLSRGDIDAVLFFSPRSAKTFVILAADAGLTGSTGSMTAICLAPAVADKLVDTAWHTISIARHPDMDSMIAATEALAAQR